jgi:hypothetical protein
MIMSEVIICIDEQVLTFGKYQGKTPEQIADVDPDYIVWLYDSHKEKYCSRPLRELCAMDIRESEYYDEFDEE